MITKKDAMVFITVFVIGTILGVIGTVSFPIGVNMSYFWPAAVIQTVGGLFFGVWGAIAGTFFPSVSNALTDGSFSHIIVLIPANFVQSFGALWFKNTFKFEPYELNKRTAVWFILCAVVTHVLGGMIGCGMLYFMGDIANQATFLSTLRVWVIGNIPCTIVFGLFLIKIIGPVLKDCGIYYEGYLK